MSLYSEKPIRNVIKFLHLYIHRYKPKLEEHLKTVDSYIEGAIATEKLKKYPHQGAKSLLIENHGFDEYYKNKDDYQGIRYLYRQ